MPGGVRRRRRERPRRGGDEGRGIEPAPSFPKLQGELEFVRVVRKKGWSVLANVEFSDVPEMALRPLTDPVPLAPVSMVWRRGLRHPGLTALADAARAIGAAERWLERPSDSWLPEADLRTTSGTGTGATAH